MTNINVKSNKAKRYTTEFKKQIVELINHGKTPGEIVQEYSISRSTLHKWATDYGRSRSFKAKDNRSAVDNEMIKLRKENKNLKMENDILKQAALIMGRK